MKVYFISGMGADSRVFKHIRLPEGYEIIHLHWIPASKNETLASYSKRLAAKIDASEKFALLGLSMGGMIASEMAKQFNADNRNVSVTILISSIPVSKELPLHFRILGSLGIHKLVPVRFLKSASVLNRFFASDKKEDKTIIRQTIKESNPLFLNGQCRQY